MNQKISIQLKLISKSDYTFLYDLLSERDDIINIDHKTLPTFEEHVEFIKSKPYSKWYIIIDNKKNKIGMIYLTKNDEIGIFLKKQYNSKGFGSKALKLLIDEVPRTRYLANINPKNKNSIKFFEKNGFLPFKLTYELKSKNHT